MWSQAGTSLHGVDEMDLQTKLRELVRHIRDQKLSMTFTDALGQACTCMYWQTDMGPTLLVSIKYD